MKSLKVQGASGWTIFVFGSLALFLGLLGLIRPELILSVMGFNVLERTGRMAGDYTLVFVVASSMASFNMGVYYVLAALNNLKAFYGWTVPFRVVTFSAFCLTVISGLAPKAWLGVAVWELTGAIATGWALYYEMRKSAA